MCTKLEIPPIEKLCDLFVKSEKRYKIECREWIDFEWRTQKSGHLYIMSKILLDTPYWSDWTEVENWRSIKLCRQRINKLNSQWVGLKEYRLGS